MRGETSPIVIILAFANARDEEPLPELVDEMRKVQKALQPAVRAGYCEMVVLPHATLADIFEAFRDHRDTVAVFHFGGHATKEMLSVENVDGSSKKVLAGPLATCLAEESGLQLVFLNACFTGGHVQGLLDAGVTSVLATSDLIQDRLAKEFAVKFYGFLASGWSLAKAYRKTSNELQAELEKDLRNAYGSLAPNIELQREWPWRLACTAGSEEKLETWNLPKAARDPCWGLPPLPDQGPPAEPFKGLQTFTEADAPIFFGRCRDIRRLCKAINQPHPIILLFGASGVGKSSFLAAGLGPRLSTTYHVIYRRRDESPWDLNDTIKEVLGGENVPAKWRFNGKDRPLVVILDQAEKAWNQPAENGLEIDRLTKMLKQIFGDPDERPPGALILSFRKEYLAEVQKSLDSSGLLFQSVFLEPLDRAGIMEAILGPTKCMRYHLTIEERLPATIADHLLADPEATIAPTLQILLTKMWQSRGDQLQAKFTVARFRELAREGQLLERFFVDQLGKIQEVVPDAVVSGLVLDILKFHTSPAGTAKNRDIVVLCKRYNQIPRKQIVALVEICKNHYLLADPVVRLGITTRLIHDILGPIVRQAFDQSDRPGQRAYRILNNRAPEYSEHKRGACLNAINLATVEAGLSGMRSLKTEEKQLLAASRKREERHRRWRFFQLSVVVAWLLSLIFMGLRSEYERDKAEVRRIAAESINHFDRDLDLALLLGLEAYEKASNPRLLRKFADLFSWGEMEKAEDQLEREALLSLLKAFTTAPPSMTGYLHGHLKNVRELAFSPNDPLLFSRSEDGQIYIWDIVQRKRKQMPWLAATIREESEPSRPIAVSPDGRYLAYSEDGCVRVREINTWKMLDLPFFCEYQDEGRKSPKEIRALVFVPVSQPNQSELDGDATVLVVAWKEGSVAFWNLANRKRFYPDLSSVPGHDQVRSLAMKAKSNLLAFGTSTDPKGCKDLPSDAGESENTCSCLTVLNLATGEIEADPIYGNSVLWTLDFHPRPESALVASGWRDKRVRIFDYERRQEVPSKKITYNGSITKVRFHPQGTRLASASWDGTISLWDMDKSQNVTNLTSHGSGVLSLAWEPEGENFASGDILGRLILWSSKETFKIHNNTVTFLEFSADGERLYSAGTDKKIKIWKTDDFSSKNPSRDEINPLKEDTVSLGGVGSLNRDQTILAVGDVDGNVSFFQAKDLKPLDDMTINPLAESREPAASRIRSVDFSSQRDLVVACGEGEKIYLKELPTGKERSSHQKGWLTLNLRFGGKGEEMAAISGEDRRLIYWRIDLEEEDPLQQIGAVELPKDCSAIAVSNDRRQLAVFGGSDLLIFQWGSLVPKFILAPHPEIVRSVTFDSSGQRLAVGYDGGTVIIWDLVTKKPAGAPLRGHQDPVMTLAFHPKDGTLASGDSEGNLAIWTEEFLVPIKRAVCDLANRNLSQIEWEQYVGGRYRQTCAGLPKGQRERAFSPTIVESHPKWPK